MPTPPAGGDRPRSPIHRLQRRLGVASARRWVAAATVLLIAIAILAVVLARSNTPTRRSSLSPTTRASGTSTGGVLSDPIDPKYLTDVPFGTTSFWIQPWRAYLDTWPASRLLNAVGVNFNVSVPEARDAARLLHESGFKLARFPINWEAVSYEDPSKLVHESDIRARLSALHAYGLRPLILLDANSGAPCPATKATLDTISPAPAGAMTVKLDPASAAEVLAGKTGFDAQVFNPHPHKRRRGIATTVRPRMTPAQRRARARKRREQATKTGLTRLVLTANPDILITKVGPGDVATLSRPLPSALAPGPHKGTTLLYAPFGPPKLSNGSPNPTFQATLKGWLSYVATVSKTAQSIFGPGGYDLEVWNELDFGSQFLNVAKYYSRPIESDPKTVTHEVTKALLAATVAFVRNPANGISPAVGITNGFANQSPFSSGAQAPIGLTALSKHPYADLRIWPAEYRVSRIRPINALGERDTANQKSFTPLFIPHYETLLPEYTLTAHNTATVIRDLAPFTTYVYGDPHGRKVGPPGGSPVQKWVTEYNLSSRATPVGPNGVTQESSVTLTTADKEHFQAKALLRSLVSDVSKGFSREYFFQAASHGAGVNLISESFNAAAEAQPNTYPGDQLGGETLTGFRNMLAQFQGPGPSGAARQLLLLSIAQDGNHAQFTGDGTAAHPDLYDRDVLAVFPFQSSPTRFVMPVYVMTQDLLTLYEPNAPSTDIHRFDLPNETFRITLGHLPETTTPPTVSAYDPLLNETTPARLISRARSTAVFEVAATDYPRVLTINYNA